MIDLPYGRPATVAANARGKAISDLNAVSEWAKKILFGQTATSER